MHVGDSSLELSTNASSSDGECEQSSFLAGSVDETNVDGASQYTSSYESFKLHKQSLHIGEGHDDIPLCAGFGREQWVGLYVVLLNDVGVPVADGICRNSDPRECVHANSLGLHDVGVCILNSLLPLEVPATWRFSLRRWPLRRVLHDEVNLWDHERRLEQTKLALLANTHPRKGLRRYESNRAPCGIRSIDGIAYWETILSVSCPPRTVVRDNVANFFRARKLGLYVKRCGLYIFV